MSKTIRTLLVSSVLLTCCSFYAYAQSGNYQEYEFLNEQGFRASHYRAPTPETVPGGKTLTTEQLIKLITDTNPVLIDVQAVTVRPELADFDMDWLPSEPRQTLPGATWLPNVGYAKLDNRIDSYFRQQLERLTNGNKSAPVVLFCVIDCWLSWNAIQRAAAYDYDQLYWYRGGTDSWIEEGHPLEQVDPIPLSH